jgi:hypothetical protein
VAMINQLLVGLVAIDAELGRDDHNSTPPNQIQPMVSNKIKMVMINFILFL